jgi:Protein of unknown function (DUF2510)
VATLEEQPAPEGGEGWHPDPLGSGNLRYFDGSAWTGNVHKPEQAVTQESRKKGRFPRPHWRKMTWVVMWSVVMAISGSSALSCSR